MSAARGRWAGALAVLLALTLAASAEAKKKHKKHKTPSSKSSGKAEPAEPEEPEETPGGTSGGKGAEEASPSSKSGGGEAGSAPSESRPSGEGGEPAPKKRAAAQGESEGEGGFALPALDVVLGGGALFRHLTWNQDVTNSFAPYSLAPGPEVGIALEVYPVAFASDSFLGNLGLFGSFNYGLGVTSKTSNGTQLTTKFQDFTAGIKLRIPFGNAVPHVSVAYGAQSFQLNGQSPLTVPGVNYAFLRPQVGARVWFTPSVDLDGGVGFLYVTSVGMGAGEIGSGALLPNATAYGIEAGVSLGIRLMGSLGLRVGGDFRQYGISGKSAQTDPIRVGGAADQYIVAWGGVEYILDGAGGGASGGEPKAAAPAGKGKPGRAEPDSTDAGEQQ
jgi:hypothetical protein